MTALLATLFVLAALMELTGIWLVVNDIRDSRQRWDRYQADRQHEREAMIADPALSLDPMSTRYGFSPWHVHRTLDAVEKLITIHRRRQTIAVFLLLGGIVLGLIGNLVGLGLG